VSDQELGRPSTRACHAQAVARVLGAMRERPGEAMSLRDMAAVAYMSRFHFDRTFRNVTGVPPRQYMRALRLHAAKRMLVQTSRSVTEVCFDVGYSSLGTFVRSFTALMGISPRRLRSLTRSPASAVRVQDWVEPRPVSGGATLTGHVTSPAPFEGGVFVGLFRGALPAGPPVGFTMIRSRGRYRLQGLPDGSFYLFAIGVPWSASYQEFALCDFALRGGGVRVDVADGVVTAGADLTLHPPSPFDPPVLVILPALISRARSRVDADGLLADAVVNA
jgi:AraC family transcriptional regulator